MLGSGDLIGALPTQLRPADPGSAAALCRPIVFAIPAWGFKRVLRDHPQVAVDLLKTAAEAIQEALARVREASMLPVEARITLTLQRLTPASDEHCSEG